MRPVLFLLILASIIGLGHAIIGWRLIAPMRLPSPWNWVAWLLLLISWAAPVATIYLFIARIRPSWYDGLLWIGFLALGVFFVTLCLVLVRDVGWVFYLVGKKVAMLASSSADSTVADQSRRQFLMRATGWGVIGLSGAFTGYGIFEARRRPGIVHITVPIRNLHPDLEGLRIAQFTDIHAGTTIGRAFIEQVVDMVGDLGCEVIAFTGDLVDGSVERLRNDVEPISKLRAPLGMYFVTGNHEYYSGVEQWITEAKRLGFDVLHNEHRVLKHGAGEFVLAGVTDYSGGNFDPSHKSDPGLAFRDAPTDLPRVLLAHQPRSIDAAVNAGCDLQISGHTHGGQIYPFHFLVALSQPYLSGLHNHNGTWIYVSCGTGYWGPPLRIGAPPEITVITLTHDQSHA